MRILIGIARGLKYLHTELDPPFTISNMNSSSIYLTDEFSPKVRLDKLSIIALKDTKFLVDSLISFCSWLILSAGRQSFPDQRKARAPLATRVQFVFSQIIWKGVILISRETYMHSGFCYLKLSVGGLHIAKIKDAWWNGYMPLWLVSLEIRCLSFLKEAPLPCICRLRSIWIRLK